ncbi:MAG: hypothetical protein U0821_17685 [Chloroflexota bacterium]
MRQLKHLTHAAVAVLLLFVGPAVVSVVVTAASSPLVQTAAAEPRGALVVVGDDGNLWALPSDEAPFVITPDLAAAGRIAGLAIHPKRPEALIVRREGSEPGAGKLLRVDLTSGDEELLDDGQGLPAPLGTPRYAPDGSWALVSVGAGPTKQLLAVDDSGARRLAVAEILPADLASRGTVELGPFTADGRALVAYRCCGEAANGAGSGIFAIGRGDTPAKLLAGVAMGVPLGTAPDGAWIATTRTVGDGRAIVVAPSGRSEERVILGPDPGATDVALVTPEGAIVLATTDARPAAGGALTGLIVVTPDGNRLGDPLRGAVTGFTAVGWMSTDVLASAAARG